MGKAITEHPFCACLAGCGTVIVDGDSGLFAPVDGKMCEGIRGRMTHLLHHGVRLQVWTGLQLLRQEVVH
jgi:hypothetical protein